MMTAALRDRLKADAAVAAIVAAGVYRDERPQGSALPAVVLYLISDPRPTTMKARQQLRQSRVQADCFARSRGAADDLAEAVITAAEGRAVVGGTRFSRAFVDGSRSDSDREEGPTGALGQTIFRTSLDLMVWHQPAPPES